MGNLADTLQKLAKTCELALEQVVSVVPMHALSRWRRTSPSTCPSRLDHTLAGDHVCTADQKLERCAVPANRAQEVHEGPHLASARLAETVS
jgi:hypothetical protein